MTEFSAVRSLRTTKSWRQQYHPFGGDTASGEGATLRGRDRNQKGVPTTGAISQDLSTAGMAFADDYFFPSVYRVRMGPQRGYSEDETQEAKEKLYDVLSRLEHQLQSREYLVGEYTLADIAHAGNFHRLRVLANSGEVSLEKYPKVMVWIERVESRESYEASV